MKVVISSGHGKNVPGASGYVEEVAEARRVVERLANHLRARNVEVITYHDDVSQTVDENLDRIVDFHNEQTRDLDISVHFNAYIPTPEGMGTECLFVSEEQLASDVASAIAAASGLINRGAKERIDLYFLNNTSAPAILIETCFVDSRADIGLYQDSFDAICDAIAGAVAGVSIPDQQAAPNHPPAQPQRPARNVVAITIDIEGDVAVTINGRPLAIVV